MKTLLSAMRLGLGLACLSVCVLFVALTLDVLPDRTEAVRNGRNAMLAGSPEFRFIAFFTVVSFCVQSIYLRFLLTHLDADPSRGIPERVRATLDTLVEGVLLLDGEKRIALANKAFAQPFGRDAEELEGRSARELDIAQREKVLEKLRRARSEVRRQNHMLRELAAIDSRTSCSTLEVITRRLEALWSSGERIGCVLVQVDGLDALTSRLGPEAGDRAIEQVAAASRATARSGDEIGRFGGDRFCVLMPGSGLDGTAQAAERFRHEVAARSLPDAALSASLGVAAREPEEALATPEDLIRRATLALDAAVRAGCNRVVRWDVLSPRDKSEDAARHDLPDSPKAQCHQEAERDVPISYHAVTSLVSALADRDGATAEHSRRVADLCVATARGFLSERDCYLLEVASLLHDVGKLGVPDVVLQKPGPLTDQDWRVMGKHDRLGVEIISAAFGSPELSEIVRTHHGWYGGNPRAPELPAGEDIPIGARILSIADAYDAMTSDRVYRRGMRRETAFQELRRCSGAQFDPALVERLVAAVLARDETRTVSVPVLSKRTAFKIGLQIEKLAAALDDKDGPRLAQMALRLRKTAEEHGIVSIAETAARLEQSVAGRDNWLTTLELTSDLLELCRSTQSSYLDTYRQASSDNDRRAAEKVTVRPHRPRCATVA